MGEEATGSGFVGCAEDAAARLEREGNEAEAAWGRDQREETLESLADRVEESPHRLSLIECANEMMAGRKRYVGKRLEGHRHSYREKQANYVGHLERSGLASKTMDRLNLAEITRWFIGFMESHAETTSARYRSWLVSVGAWGQSNDYWRRNLFVNLPELEARVSEASKRVYTFEEIDRMWEAAWTPQQRAMLVLLRVGFRQGETLAADESAVTDRHIEVRYTLTEATNVWSDLSVRGVATKNVGYLGRPKTPGSQAAVYVPPAWMEIVKTALKSARWSAVRAFTDENGEVEARRFIVSNRFGLCLEEGSASAAMRCLMERAGIRVGDNESTFHAWRHTFCSDLVALGANDVTLSYLMRHRDANLSKTVYASARQDGLSLYRQYAKRIDGITDYIDAIFHMDEDRRAMRRAAAKVA